MLRCRLCVSLSPRTSRALYTLFSLYLLNTKKAFYLLFGRDADTVPTRKPESLFTTVKILAAALSAVVLPLQILAPSPEQPATPHRAERSQRHACRRWYVQPACY